MERKMKSKVLFSLLVVAGMLVSTTVSAAVPGLPFTEDFSDTIAAGCGWNDRQLVHR